MRIKPTFLSQHFANVSSKKPKKGLTDEELDNLSFELLGTD
jgi:hypothetical protein